MRIYLASPYSAGTYLQREKNVEKAMEVGLGLLESGYQPFIPVLSHYWDDYAYEHEITVPYDRWMEWALTWVVQCDAVLVIGMSPGVEREIECALKNKIPVFYSASELPPSR